MNKNIAIFASGSGTNTQNIIEYFKNDTDINVRIIVSNKKDAYVLERAHKLGVQAVVFGKEKWQTGEEILSLMKENEIDYIILAGFLLKVPQALIDAYPQRIMNIHPALLPKYGGKSMYGDRVHEAVVAAGEKESGITIHFIDENYDRGQTIFQAKCEVLPTDTAEDVATKVHALEYKWYPVIIKETIKKGL
jgi:phosphoribosylglycinamide formyltransferase-1